MLTWDAKGQENIRLRGNRGGEFVGHIKHASMEINVFLGK